MSAIKSASRKPKVDVRQAANAAADYFKMLFPNVGKFSLEEVELSDDEHFWWITLGFETHDRDFRPNWAKNLEELYGKPRTKYKRFKVDSRTGRVVAMKIPQLG
ncbi:MAG TPA: hypothetical protein VFB72_10115 [Verrucomicrobiae bacterium]|nr:hypothetical protein [Verrucomicrobiae bacterium]